MIDIASRRYGDRPGLEYVVGDALAMPTEDASFDAATIAFGMRNLPDYRRGFEEMARSVRPGGRVLCLEIARPRSRLARFMRWWFDRIVPLIGRVAGPGRRLRLPRPERPQLSVARADRRDHGRGGPRGRPLARADRRHRHAPRRIGSAEVRPRVPTMTHRRRASAVGSAASDLAAPPSAPRYHAAPCPIPRSRPTPRSSMPAA